MTNEEAVAQSVWTCVGCGQEVSEDEVYVDQMTMKRRCVSCVPKNGKWLGPISMFRLRFAAKEIGLAGHRA